MPEEYKKQLTPEEIEEARRKQAASGAVLPDVIVPDSGAVAPEKPVTPTTGAQGTYADQYAAMADEYGKNITASAGQTAEALKKIYADYMASMDAAEQERQRRAVENNTKIRELIEQGYTAQEAMIKAAQRDVDQAKAVAAENYRADMNAAKYTGLTTLAASLLNLGSVVNNNAVSQQFKDFSQDWMRKADHDLMIRRARIDNLRDRQRQMQMRYDQLKQQGGLTILQQQAAEDAARNKFAGERAATARDAATATAKIEADARDKAAGVAYEGKAKGLAAQQQQEQFETKMKQDDRHHNDMMSYYRSRGGSGSGRGDTSGDLYDVTIDGKQVTLRIGSNAFKQAVLDGKSEIKEDLKNLVGASSWKELEENTGRRGKYSEFADIVQALNGSGDNEYDNEVIERFLQDNRPMLNNFNKHLQNVSNGAIVRGLAEDDNNGAETDFDKLMKALNGRK